MADPRSYNEYELLAMAIKVAWIVWERSPHYREEPGNVERGGQLKSVREGEPVMPTKCEFIEDQLIVNSIGGAFQRAKVYADAKGADEKERKYLRDKLRDLLRELKRQYADEVSNEQHSANIQRIADDLTNEFAERGLLHENRFRIGIAQKALNLFLKYLWCLGKVATPPHSPFDDGIIARLPLSQEQKGSLRWTKLDSMADYQILIAAASTQIKTDGYASLSEWELANFSFNIE